MASGEVLTEGTHNASPLKPIRFCGEDGEDATKLQRIAGMPFLLGMSLGNPFYTQEKNLYKLFEFGNKNSKQVKVFLTDVIGEHNYRAVHSSNPEKNCRLKGNEIRNKCKRAMKQIPDLDAAKFSQVNWREEVETSTAYQQQLEFIMNLFSNHEQFRREVLDVTDKALACLFKGRMHVAKENKTGVQKGRMKDAECQKDIQQNLPVKGQKGNICFALTKTHSEYMHIGSNLKSNNAMQEGYDVMEGVNYLLKELAFLLAVPNILVGYEEFVFIYHRPWPILENLFGGIYDGCRKSGLNFVILE